MNCMDIEFKRERHIKYFKLHLDLLPEKTSCYDTIRITLLFFAISGLDILNAIDEVLSKERRKEIIDWLYKLQVVPNEENSNLDACGFQGSSTFNFRSEDYVPLRMDTYRVGNIAQTYSALCVLVILGDDLSRVNKKAILHGVKALQNKSGSFKCELSDGDSDMRFVFCAASICYILNDWSGMNQSLCKDFIFNSMSYDFAFAQGPNLEAHGGSTYCALASLHLMNQLDKLNAIQMKGLKRWLILRQKSSFQGRPNKPVDTCYTFWIGASLSLLDSASWIDEVSLVESVLETQHNFGGFSKWVDTQSDVLHTYLGIAGLSLIKERPFILSEVSPGLNITLRAFKHLKQLHKSWEDAN